VSMTPPRANGRVSRAATVTVMPPLHHAAAVESSATFDSLRDCSPSNFAHAFLCEPGAISDAQCACDHLLLLIPVESLTVALETFGGMDKLDRTH